MRTVAVLALLSLGALAACGARDGAPHDGIPEAAPSIPAGAVADASSGAPASSLPACSAIWVAGRALPSDYAGCVTTSSGSGGAVVQQSTAIACTDGTSLMTYGDRWWVRTPGRIAEAPHGLAADLRYTRAHDACLL